MNNILSLDYQIFELINGAQQPVLNYLMAYISKTLPWLPLFLFLFYLLFKHYSLKAFLSLFVATALLITIVDKSANWTKHNSKRPRPCSDSSFFEGKVNFVDANFKTVVKSCGTQFGFFSGHAANTSAGAVFFFLLLYKKSKSNWWHLIWLWPLLSAYSRVYLGVHYPLDVLVGLFFGSSVAFLLYKLLHTKLFNLTQIKA